MDQGKVCEGRNISCRGRKQEKVSLRLKRQVCEKGRKGHAGKMEEKYYYWLHNVSGIGKETRRKLLEKIGSPKELFEGSLEKCKYILNQSQIDNLEESRWNWDLEKEWSDLQKRQIHFSYYGGKNYPEKLKNIPDPPFCLYQKGKLECLRKPAVAVVGARNCSLYGGLAAKELGRELAKSNIVVISGMARGIDGMSQWAALEQNGESIGVLGSGVEVCYPKENRYLYERLQVQGSILSENAPFTQPRAGLFPMRNRIISGLADVVVVVEAAEKSGTLITVDMALEQGKEVFAIPGRMTDRYSRGCNQLMKQGAGIILSPREFVEEICPILQVKYHRQGEQKERHLQMELTKEEQQVLSVMDTELKSIEEIYGEVRERKIQMALPKVMEVVVNLRMKQLVGEKEGYYFAVYFKE